jgi:hypothetical protein
MTAIQLPPKLACRPTVCNLLTLLFSILHALLPRARDRRYSCEPRIPLAFRGGSSLSKRERLSRIAPRDKAARRRSFVRIVKCPRDAPPLSFYLSSTA